MNSKIVLEKSRKTINELTKIEIAIISLGVFILAIISFEIVRYVKTSNQLNELRSQVVLLENKFSSTTEELRSNILQNHTALSDALNQEKRNVGNIEKKLGDYADEVGSFSNTVTDLQKLSKTDPELLAKYSKVFFLNENYAPARLAEIPAKYKYSDTKILKLNELVWPYAQKMIDDANAASTTIYAYSAYRSFNEQQALKGQYSVIYGSGSANAFSADQGYSEHQLGTTLDLITPGLNGSLDGFEKTKAYNWLLDNAYKYGFILSYPEKNKFYVFEPWHWRFVGKKLAKYLDKQNKSFYDLDQREIDEYLVSLFD
jgi:D-alanyl-D-alanine carboxypeptidase